VTSGSGFALFETAIGVCGIAWNRRGIAGVQLPLGSADSTRLEMRRRFPGAREGAPAHGVERAIAGIVALLRGEPGAGLESIALDMEPVPAFERRVYEIARTIPAGSTLSYGEVAARVGEPDAAREVGQALGRNPFAIIVPCHRVLAAGGKLGGFSARGGARTKFRLLAIEGTSPSDAPTLFVMEPSTTLHRSRRAAAKPKGPAGPR